MPVLLFGVLGFLFVLDLSGAPWLERLRLGVDASSLLLFLLIAMTYLLTDRGSGARGELSTISLLFTHPNLLFTHNFFRIISALAQLFLNYA